MDIFSVAVIGKINYLGKIGSYLKYNFLVSEINEVSMSTNWYYVENNERVGPVNESDFLDLIVKSVIGDETYVWRKGLDNWAQAKNLDELKGYLNESNSSIEVNSVSDNKDSEYDKENADSVLRKEADIKFNWDEVDEKSSIFILRIGEDRGGEEKEYGPYSMEVIKKLIKQKRVNHLTQVFSPGMSDWHYLSSIDQLSSSFEEKAEFHERRNSKRCPISARVFLSDNKSFFQGVCRDVSVGGAQVLVANFPGKEGDIVKVNMHFV